MGRIQRLTQAMTRATPGATSLAPLVLTFLIGCGWTAPAAAAEPAAAKPKVVRFAFNAAETGFDPAQVSDRYSATIIGHMIEPPLTFNYVDRPIRIEPRTAAALPVPSADFKQWTLKIKPGIHFADDPAFGGKPRELTAGDYVYALKRHYDPHWKSQQYQILADNPIPGLEELRQKALKDRAPFNYDTAVSGLHLVDRYTLQITLTRADPRFQLLMTNVLTFGAVAREVVERYGDEIMAHPVGTGPFQLAQWRRSSLTVLTRNPGFREEHYDSHPAADDAVGQALAKRFNGRRLPMVDRLEFAIIEAAQPTWLSFLAKDFELVVVPLEFAPIAAPGGKLAPNLAKQGLQLERVLQADHSYTFFNMDDPVVGGYTPEKVALRRAISLAYDNRTEIQRVRRGLGIPAKTMLVPNTLGYDEQVDFGFSEYDPAKAKALLDLYGYVDRDGDGWRDRPDGSPLVLDYASQSDDTYRQLQELWQKYMRAVGLNMKFSIAQWPDQFKQAKAGKLMIWGLGNSATSPDGQDFLNENYGAMIGSENLSRFKLPAYDQLVAQSAEMPDGPERNAVMNRAQALLAAYMPAKPHAHRVRLYLSQPWLLGYRDHPFARDFGRYVDVDADRQPAPKH